MPRIALTGTALVAILIAVIWLARASDSSNTTGPTGPPAEPVVSSANENSPSPASLPGVELATRFDADPGAAVDSTASVDSWQEAEPDGQIAFDDQGRLLVDLALRQRFDFILTGLGEASLDRLRIKLLTQLQGEFDADQIAQVLAEFDLYVDYLQAADMLITASGPDLDSRFAALVQLQHDLLGPERAGAWFRDDNAYLERTLAVIAGDIEPGQPELDPWASEIQAATSHHLAMEMANQYEQLDSDPTLRFTEREALYGTEAAKRLAELDNQRSAWNARVQAYQAERERLIASAHPQDRIAQALQQWMDHEFDASEQRRIRALEQAGLIDGSP